MSNASYNNRMKGEHVLVAQESRSLKFTTNGIRGIANVDLTPATCTRIGQSMGTYLGGGKVLVGTDYRVSGAMVKSGLVAGLLGSGVNVEDAGFTPTPALQKYIKDTARFDMGLMITASHNPPEFNGIKVIDRDGIELPASKEREIESIFNNEVPGFSLPEWNGMGLLEHNPDIVKYYRKRIGEVIPIDGHGARDIHVVVDPGNGIACSYFKELLDDIGVRVTSIFDEPDGTFPNRVSEPTPRSLEQLKDAIVKERASFGIGFDGDGDRAIFIDDKGVFHWGDESFAVILNHLLETYKGWVVTPVSSSMLVDEIVNARGAKLEWTKVGSITVSRRMQELDAMIAGEENGGIFYTPFQPVRDGGVALALIIKILVKRNVPLSELFAELPKYHLHKETIKVENYLKDDILARIKKVTSEERRTLIDGVKIFKDGGSVLIRPSGTEPKFRSFADSKSMKGAIALAKWGIKLVKEAMNSI
ncbi:phosphoglucosamine mutase [Candidatus Bathyarchaeota archaeon]|nr:phosphoglucosamine mutase [Candidatus Bathyarchaeota archaeon]